MANIPKIKSVRVRQLDNNGNVSYNMEVVVKHDDQNEVANVITELTPVGNAPAPSTNSLVCTYVDSVSVKNKKYYVNASLGFSGDALDFKYNITATMKKADGSTIGVPETKSTRVDNGEADTIPGIKDIRITKTSTGEYNIYVDVVNNSAGLVPSVSVTVVPSASDNAAPPPLGRGSLTCGIQTNALFVNLGGLQFGSDALGHIYTTTAVIDGGDSLQKDVTVVSE